MDNVEKDQRKIIDLAAEQARKAKEEHVRKQIEGGRTLREETQVSRLMEDLIRSGDDPRDIEISFGNSKAASESRQKLMEAPSQGETAKVIPFKRPSDSSPEK